MKKSLCDVRNVRKADISSDNHLIVAHIQLKTAAVNKSRKLPVRKTLFNVEKLRSRENCQLS
jgi:hypothetical protein